jgi:phosphatidylglycerol:prolipoprotein diacylglycerol transferase
VSLGLLLGAVLVLLDARREKIDVRPAVDAALAAALGALVLARAAYVGAHWAYYADHTLHALQLWRGGLLWQGALLGGIAGAAAACALRGLRLPQLLDILTSGAASVAVFGWLACFTVGCAWGIETYPGQGLLWALSLDLPDLYGIREPRVAVQLLGAGWSAILLGVILALQRRPRRDGVVFSLWLTLHSAGSLALGFLRADELPSVAGWRVDQWANLALSAVGIALLTLHLIASTLQPDSAAFRP